MATPTDVVYTACTGVAELEESEEHLGVQAQPAAITSTLHEPGGQIAEHETILMTVGDSSCTDVDRTTVAELDGATAGDNIIVPELSPPECSMSSSAVAIDDDDDGAGAEHVQPMDAAGVLEPVFHNYNIGYTTELQDHTAGPDEPGLPGPEIIAGGQPPVHLVLAAAVDNGAPALIEALRAELPARDIRDELPAVEESSTPRRNTTRDDVDLGWGIVVGELSREDFNEILAFPTVI